MYPVSLDYLSDIKKNSRTVNARITIGATVIPVEGIANFTLEESFGTNKMPTIGGSSSSVLTVKLINSYITGLTLIDVPIKPEVAILVGVSYEWVPLGVFYANNSDVTIDKLSTTIEAFDFMDRCDEYIFESQLTYPTTVQAILEEIEADYPITFTSYIAPLYEYIEYITLESSTYQDLETRLYDVPLTFTIDSAPTGTLRQVLSKIAFRIGANALFDRNGFCTFRFLVDSGFSLDAENYMTYNLTSASPNRISQIILAETDNDDTPLITGDDTGMALNITSDVVTTQGALDEIFNRVYPMNFYSYVMKLQGMPHIEVGDTFDFTDIDNNLYRFDVVYHKLTFDGGLTSNFEVAFPEKKTAVVEVNQTTGTIGDSIKKVGKTLSEAITTATGLITGNLGGNVMFKMNNAGKPEEILILVDSDDINTVTKLWRWNASGLGFSSTGYNGDYGLALTSNGEIVADRVTSGILNANIIKSGTLESTNGITNINLDTGFFNLGNMVKLDENGLTIMLSGGKTVETAIEESVSDLNSEMDTLGNYIVIDSLNGLITIGEKKSPIKLQLDNNEISFLEYTKKVMYIDTGKMYINKGEFVESLTIGNFAFVPRTNGNLSFRKVK